MKTATQPPRMKNVHSFIVFIHLDSKEIAKENSSTKPFKVRDKDQASHQFCKVMAAGWTAGALASSTANGFLSSIIDNNQDEIYEATSISFHGSNVQNERCHRRTIFVMEQ